MPHVEIDPLIGIQDVEKATGRGRKAIARDVKAGRFVEPVYICGRRAWRLSEVKAWIATEAARGARRSNLPQLREVSAS